MFSRTELICIAQGRLIVCRGFQMSTYERGLFGRLRGKAQNSFAISGKCGMMNET
jgi:hypothetical protein